MDISRPHGILALAEELVASIDSSWRRDSQFSLDVALDTVHIRVNGSVKMHILSALSGFRRFKKRTHEVVMEKW